MVILPHGSHRSPRPDGDSGGVMQSEVLQWSNAGLTQRESTQRESTQRESTQVFALFILEGVQRRAGAIYATSSIGFSKKRRPI